MRAAESNQRWSRAFGPLCFRHTVACIQLCPVERVSPGSGISGLATNRHPQSCPAKQCRFACTWTMGELGKQEYYAADPAAEGGDAAMK
jgi:hypothetical protein